MLTEDKKRELKIFSKTIQMEIMKELGSLGIGHLGGSLSIADVLAVLYGKQMKYDPKNPRWEGRDWFICSKGHAGPAVYAALALKGFMPMEQLDTLNRPGTKLPSHCDRNLTPGIDMTTGSLGQGASTAAGVATAHKLNGADNTVYLMLGDGESNEGQVWEMVLYAAQQKLDNFIVFVDYNRMQIDGTTDEVCSLGDLAEKFTTFGWDAVSVDGHDVAAIDEAIDNAKQAKGKPSAIILNTIKGIGWSKSEGQLGSHNQPVSKEQMEEALAEMQAALDEIKKGA